MSEPELDITPETRESYTFTFVAPADLREAFDRAHDVLRPRFLEAPNQAQVLRYLLRRGINATLADAMVPGSTGSSGDK